FDGLAAWTQPDHSSAHQCLHREFSLHHLTNQQHRSRNDALTNTHGVRPHAATDGCLDLVLRHSYKTLRLKLLCISKYRAADEDPHEFDRSFTGIFDDYSKPSTENSIKKARGLTLFFWVVKLFQHFTVVVQLGEVVIVNCLAVVA